MLRKFPNNFFWGSATSAHQVEGGNVKNDWYQFEKAGFVKNGEVSGVACDHYNLYKNDFSTAKSLNQNCQRISIEWSRIEPALGEFDVNEIQHYRDVLLELKKLGMTSFVTLHHFTNPIWFSDLGGWVNNESSEYFEEFVYKIILELGSLIDFWITVNEPTLYLGHSYIKGDRPPRKRNIILAYKATQNYIKAHKKAYTAIHKSFPEAKVGIANNFIKYGIPYIPYIPILNPVLNTFSYFWNFYFLDKINKYQDFIGVNYYTSTRFMQVDLGKRKKADGDEEEISKKLNRGFKIYPEGIYYILMRVWRKYRKPIYVTENGLPDCKDKIRQYYIASHLDYIHQAMVKGADVRGYIHWALLDNFEWNHGFGPRFGLCEVDYETLERKPRESAKYYSEICRTGVLKNGYKFRTIR